jgi:hypothetical protein
MAKKHRFKCLHCREVHVCDARNRGRQRYCGKPECRKASKADSQRRWAGREENKNYFRGSAHVERVRRWRGEHPGYWRKKGPVRQDALQETFAEQVVDKEKDTPQGALLALQDSLPSQMALIVGLISSFTGYALQEDIAASVRSLQSRGEDILRMGRGVVPPTDHEKETCSVCVSAAARAAPV